MSSTMEQSFSGSGSQTITTTDKYTILTIINDGTAAVNISVGGVSFSLLSGETLQETFDPFSTVIITTSSDWRCYLGGSATEVTATTSGTTTFGVFLADVRYAIGDINGTKVSDYQIMSATNAALNLINYGLIYTNSNILTRTATVYLTDGVGQLPSDYATVIAVNLSGSSSVTEISLTSYGNTPDDTNYYIMGRTIYSANDELTVIYKCFLGRIKSNSQLLPLPDLYLEMIKKYTILALNNQIGNIPMTQIQQDMWLLSGGSNDRSAIDVSLPWELT